MWIYAMAYHVSAFRRFVTHAVIHEFPRSPSGCESGMNTIAACLAASPASSCWWACVWIARRTFGPYKNLSVPEDYLLLFLLLGVVAMGDHMRFVYGGTIHAAVYREWFLSLLRFKPEFPAELLSGNVGISLGTHMLFTDLFLMYFPFSKLVHSIGAFSSNLVRSE